MFFWCQNSFQKTNEIISVFLPWIFCTFLGASWKLFQLLGDLVSNIMNKEAYRKPKKASRKPQGRYIHKISGQKSRNNFVGFLEGVLTSKGHFEINWPLKSCIKCLLPINNFVLNFVLNFFGGKNNSHFNPECNQFLETDVNTERGFIDFFPLSICTYLIFFKSLFDEIDFLTWFVYFKFDFYCLQKSSSK